MRAHLMANRLAMDDAQRRGADEARLRIILDLLHDLPIDQMTIALYLSRPPEPSTIALAAELHRCGARLLVPAASRGWTQPDWAWYEEPLVIGPRNIPVAPGRAVGMDALGQAQIIVLPGLAGARDGTRLGTGGGWYDKALGSASPDAKRWLLLGDDEVFDQLPSQPHDLPVHRLITPSGTTLCCRAATP